jgi:hypothetical protein
VVGDPDGGEFLCKIYGTEFWGIKTIDFFLNMEKFEKFLKIDRKLKILSKSYWNFQIFEKLGTKNR